MSLTDLSQYDTYKAVAPSPSYPANLRTLYAPVDQVHVALLHAISGAAQSVVVAMYGFDDNALANVIKEKLNNPNIFVQLTLDESQSVGAHERELLAAEDYPASSIAIGRSEKRAIMHLKEFVLDGELVGTGSTNWSSSGQSLQDNQLTLIADPYVAAEARARIDAVHANMLLQARSTQTSTQT
jgi:phosphatidylserine/phosphatidylglycerophosphate/cardiolipin synthase-like enzyme